MRIEGPWTWRSRKTAIVAGGAVLLAIAIGFALLGKPHAKVGEAAQQSATIAAQPFVATLGVAGQVAAGDIVAVVAPFDGRVTKVNFEFGDPVQQDQVLATLDTTEIGQRRDEAEAEFLKATQSAAELANWSNGAEVSQARRGETSAATELEDTNRKISETRTLFDRGLVARDELDNLVQQQRSQTSALAAARQDLAETLKRGAGANRRVADIELHTAQARLEELQTQFAGASLRAPTAGVIVRPPGEKADTASPAVHAGMSLTRGQLIAAIARPGGLTVSFQLSEADANRVRPGQRVEATGPGFAGMSLPGVVATVARDATPATGDTAVSFAATARLDPLTPAQAAVIRIGMTANVMIDLYRNPSALTAPPGAIQGTAPDTFVMVKDTRSGQLRRVAVQIGQTAADGVEILSGLKPGDVVVWTPDSTGDSDDKGS